MTDDIAKLKSESLMLGRIAAHVEDFAESDEDTTLICVLRLLAKYHSMEADSLWDLIRKEEESQK